MKKYITITMVILLAVSFWNCEKDDICADGTPVTPRVIIEFYDATNTSTLKNVANLLVIEPTLTQGFPFNGKSKIEVPLRTNALSTTLNFVQNGSDSDATNDLIDTVTFNYETSEVYVSRACGFKTLFYLNETNGYITTNNWITNYTIVQPNIENENEIHIKLYF